MSSRSVTFSFRTSHREQKLYHWIRSESHSNHILINSYHVYGVWVQSHFKHTNLWMPFIWFLRFWHWWWLLLGFFFFFSLDVEKLLFSVCLQNRLRSSTCNWSDGHHWPQNNATIFLLTAINGHISFFTCVTFKRLPTSVMISFLLWNYRMPSTCSRTREHQSLITFSPRRKNVYEKLLFLHLESFSTTVYSFCNLVIVYVPSTVSLI